MRGHKSFDATKYFHKHDPCYMSSKNTSHNSWLISNNSKGINSQIQCIGKKRECVWHTLWQSAEWARERERVKGNWGWRASRSETAAHQRITMWHCVFWWGLSLRWCLQLGSLLLNHSLSPPDSVICWFLLSLVEFSMPFCIYLRKP